MQYNFPKNFMWGAATSAPQSEGHSLENGKSATTWDKWFEMNPEKFYNNEGPENTSMLYDHYKEDVQRMKELGFNSFRTSISWARLLPDGKTVNQEAVDFYRDYFNELLQNDIKPIINLFHFDMPWWLMEKGGWENSQSSDYFQFYAEKCFELFGDQIQNWTTFNEPLVHIEMAYLHGYHYPAIHDFKKAITVGYNTLLAHAKAVKALKDSEYANTAKIGIILNLTPAYPKSEAAADKLAAKNADLLNIYSFLTPALSGKINDELVALLKQSDLIDYDQIHFDAEIIKYCEVDFLGVNYYQPIRVQAPLKHAEKIEDPSDLYANYEWKERRINPYRGWEIYPEAIYDIAKTIDKLSDKPWYISENGMGVADEERFMNADGMIEDDYRIDFMKEHLAQLNKAIEEGSNCIGYHTWTFIDCWSWLNGYKNRYGFYRVDLNDYSRTIKKSGLWYRELAQNNGFD
ncbi:glycoside hydrolase family 1 protein [Lactobacillus sp. YT155]|uniref:glycoside hydrolase family 1 protein n=1 Tax=Lactobacillus sp. YT155 TaxID=3060955 RepID=UPI00265EB06E|nr:glycoside hydrolase family 1 protein [Lactobacillus sp. YT155]MDO1604493.1 glycoside hydrolase family 1 protein [Lactobacillus sp. YT155]